MCFAFSLLEKEVCKLSRNKLIQWKKVLLARLLTKWAKTECKVSFSYFVLLSFIIIIIYFLKFWYMFTMYFDHTHTLQVSLTFHKTYQVVSLSHSRLYFIFFILYYYSFSYIIFRSSSSCSNSSSSCSSCCCSSCSSSSRSLSQINSIWEMNMEISMGTWTNY